MLWPYCVSLCPHGALSFNAAVRVRSNSSCSYLTAGTTLLSEFAAARRNGQSSSCITTNCQVGTFLHQLALSWHLCHAEMYYISPWPPRAGLVTAEQAPIPAVLAGLRKCASRCGYVSAEPEPRELARTAQLQRAVFSTFLSLALPILLGGNGRLWRYFRYRLDMSILFVCHVRVR